MKSRAKVSVLVPIYNVEDFLGECLDSLVKQTLKDIEIVCINDGSTDGSLKIVKEYDKNDPRIVIIDKKNTGYGDSMNQGLDKATGEYVGIVEPDDFIELDAFEKMYKIAKTNNLDVVKANFYEYFTDKKRDVAKSNMFLSEEENIVLDPREQRHVFYEQPSIWSAIYNRKFLNDNNIRFLPSPGASYQDAGFNFKVWASAKKVIMLNSAFLHYRQDNPNSSVKSEGKVYAVKDEYDEVEKWLKKRGLYEEYSSTLAGMRFSSYIWNMRRLTRKTAKEFAKTVRTDYARLEKEGVLDREKLDTEAYGLVRQLPVKHPMIYLDIRPIYESRGKMLRFGSNTVRRISPMHRQQERAMKNLDELNFLMDEIMQELDNYEEKNEVKNEK